MTGIRELSECILSIWRSVFSSIFKDSTSICIEHSRYAVINKNLIKHFIISLKYFLTVKIGSYNLSVCIISPAYFDLGRLGCASCSSSTLIDSFISFFTFSDVVSFILPLSFFFKAFFGFFWLLEKAHSQLSSSCWVLYHLSLHQSHFTQSHRNEWSLRQRNH